MEQITTFGSIITATRVCEDIKNNLYTAKERNENPIAAERLVNNNYLLYLQIVFDELVSIHNNNKMTKENFVNLNEYIRTLLSLAKNDGILSEQQISLSGEDLRATIINVFNRLDSLEI